jgi:hypothetical protein
MRPFAPGARTLRARLPWAGLLALAALLALDRGAFGLRATWAALSARDPFGVATPQLALRDARAQSDARPRALAVGPSRVIEGFSVQVARKALPHLALSKVAHPRFDPFVTRSLVPELLAARPAAVVFVWSELETNRPLRLEPVPGSSVASLAAVWELVEAAGWRFALENRTTLYRLVASDLLGGYRYRSALFQAGLDERRRFALDARIERRHALPRIFGEIVYWGAEPREVSAAQRREILSSFGPAADPRFVDLSIDFVAEITAGPHAELQRSFMQRTAALLRARGVEVLVVEGPLHPRARQLYDAGLRRDFLAFMERLERELGVHFTPLEELPPFPAGDFKDLLHTRGSGSAKLTDAIVRALRASFPAGAAGG